MRHQINILLIAAIVCIGTNRANAAVVINELDSDQTGSDTLEFIELHGPANTLLNGLVLVFWNGANDEAYQAYDLDGWRTGPTGHFLIGDAAVTPTPDIIIPNITLHNGPDAVALYNGDASDFPVGTAVTNSNLIDALVYGTPVHADDTELLTVLGQSIQYEDTLTESISRVPDGMGNAFANGTTPTPMNSGIPQVPEPATLLLLLSFIAATNFARRPRA